MAKPASAPTINPTNIYVGHRLSYGGALCTTRYIGDVNGTAGQWLGVEWDDPDRGLSAEPTAASFIRLSKKVDGSRSLLHAILERYGSDGAQLEQEANAPLTIISGKPVENIGFDTISRKVSTWSNLKIVSLDGMCINGLYEGSVTTPPGKCDIKSTLLPNMQWEELDLSRNLFEDWDDILSIGLALEQLRVITLCTHRLFPNLDALSLAFNPLSSPPNPSVAWIISRLLYLTTLDLTSCSLTALQSLSFLADLPNLQILILRSNPLKTLYTEPSFTFPRILTLDLTSTHLATFSTLDAIPSTFPRLTSLKTSKTPLSTSDPSARLLTIARLPQITSLNNTPIPTHERQNAEIYYIHQITALLLAAETRDQEQAIVSQHPVWQYLILKHNEPDSLIQKRNSRANEAGQPASGPRYPPVSVGAHLATFTFHHTAVADTDTKNEAKEKDICEEHTLSLPILMNIYSLKAHISKKCFRIPPLQMRLIIETEEWDPVPPSRLEEEDWTVTEDESSNDDDDDDDDEPAAPGNDESSLNTHNADDTDPITSGENDITGAAIDASNSSAATEILGPRIPSRRREQNEKAKAKVKKRKERNRWTRREIEIPDSARKISHWVEAGQCVRVRVERKGEGRRV
ncbi:MAG: hypothetical protein Q9220_003477 [cf. Caloplaca sp. 1 TL-2023]